MTVTVVVPQLRPVRSAFPMTEWPGRIRREYQGALFEPVNSETLAPTSCTRPVSIRIDAGPMVSGGIELGVWLPLPTPSRCGV